MKYSGTLLVVLTLAVSCVKPYDFEQQNFERILVIDGLISNEPGPYEVNISYTYPLDTNITEFVRDAVVQVENGDGSIIEYVWVEDGTYQSQDVFIGSIGQTYRLTVDLPDGRSFVSTAEEMIAPPPIDSIYDRYAELPNEEGEANVGGIQFFIDSHDDSGVARHFRYEWEEGYKIVVPFPAAYEFDAVDSTIVPIEENLGVCYQEEQSSELIYSSTVGAAENRIAEFAVRFVGANDIKLRTRYAILVKQYAISESAYLFYKRLQENNDSGGSLFDQQTGSVFGNINEVGGSGEPVLGYFEVSGVSQRRQFFNKLELDRKLGPIRFRYNCSLDDVVIVSSIDSVQYYLDQVIGHIFNYAEFPPDPPQISIHRLSCTDCTFWADNTPPDYWEE